MLWTRRKFLLASIAAVPAAGVAQTRPRPILRIGCVLADHQDGLRRGIRFGVEEVTRSAMLLGWQISAAAASSADDTRFDALISGMELIDHASQIPIVRVAQSRVPLAPNELAICPSAESSARAEAKHVMTGVTAERRIVVWHHTLERFGAAQLNDRFRGTGRLMDSDGWLGWFATKAIWETAARAQSAAPTTLMQRLRDPNTKFDGHKGVALRFGANGELVQPLYVVERAPTGSGWKVVAELQP